MVSGTLLTGTGDVAWLPTTARHAELKLRRCSAGTHTRVLRGRLPLLLPRRAGLLDVLAKPPDLDRSSAMVAGRARSSMEAISAPIVYGWHTCGHGLVLDPLLSLAGRARAKSGHMSVFASKGPPCMCVFARMCARCHPQNLVL
jgi:hypothetical protein